MASNEEVNQKTSTVCTHTKLRVKSKDAHLCVYPSDCVCLEFKRLIVPYGACVRAGACMHACKQSLSVPSSKG